MKYVIPQRALVRPIFLLLARKLLLLRLHESGLVELIMAEVDDTVCSADDPPAYWHALGHEMRILRSWSADCSQIISNSFGISCTLHRTLRGLWNMMHLRSILAECCPYNPKVFSRSLVVHTSQIGNKRKRVPGRRMLARTLASHEMHYIRAFVSRVQLCCAHVLRQKNLLMLADQRAKSHHYINITQRACIKLNAALDKCICTAV